MFITADGKTFGTIGGGLPGLAVVCEVFVPIGQLQTSISLGYGYTAIIGRLNPLGIILFSLLWDFCP